MKRFRLPAAAAVAVTVVASGVVVAPGRSSGALTQQVAERVGAAVVQLGPLYTGKDKTTGKSFQGSFPWGNGSIVTASGYILTSSTTANVGVLKEDARKNGAEIIDGVLVVSIAKSITQLPAPAFLAKVVAIDPVADLALLQVSTDLSGKPLAAGSVQFPTLPFGNADALKIGDVITAIGFLKPADSASYADRTVKDFQPDAAFNGRSAIVLSKSIASGYVGTSAVDATGRLVAVAAFGADRTPPPSAPTPCTPTVDTNRDGRIDSSDTCPPVDPGISALRSVNAVMAFFAKVSKGQSSAPTTTVPAVGPNPAPAPSPGPAPAPAPNPGPAPAPNPAPLPPPATVPATVPPAGPPPSVPTKPSTAANDVYMFGHAYDSATGRPITDGFVFVHKPGSVIGKATQADVIATFKIDERGKWGFPSYRWKRGENYPIAFFAKGYKLAYSNSFKIEPDAPDPFEIDVEMDPE
jgi:Trypsin-like peptidase domain